MVAKRFRSQFRELRSELEDSTPALFQQWVPTELVTGVLRELEIKFRTHVFPPVVVVWLWLSQVFATDSSCSRAVAKAIAWLLADRKEPCSSDHSAYCQSRTRLAESVPQRVAQRLAAELEVHATDVQYDRDIWLYDGTTCTAADTPENQEEYPQSPGQKEGCGFPLIRLVGMFSLVTGALHELAFGSFRDSEHKLFRQLWDRLKPGDLAVADSLYNSYVHLVQLGRRGVDVVFRQDRRRKFDFRKGRRLGPKDALFTLHRAPVCQRPAWMSEEEYRQEIPETLEVRVLEYTVDIPGFRSDKIRLITTLLDPAEFSREALAELYARRWRVELDLRDIKITLGMDFINVQTPAMIRKSIWMHMLGYNVTRKVMWDASVRYGRAVEELSFKGSLQLIEEVAVAIGAQPERATREAYEKLLQSINQRPLRARPNRSEPRVLKRRHKNYRYMTRPRHKCQPRKKLTA